MFANLPHDNIAKVIFFGGLLFISILIHYDIQSGEEHEIARKTHNYKVIELKKQRSLDSLEMEDVSKSMAALQIDSAKHPLNDSAILKLSQSRIKYNKIAIDRRAINETFAQMESDMEVLQGNEGNDDIALPVAIIAGTIFLFIGLIAWGNKEDAKEAYEKRKIQKEEREIPCQSCGMVLKYDFRPFIEVELCSNCYDGTNYIEPSLSLKEMKTRIQQKMEEQKVDPKLIKRHLVKLEHLNRWEKTLRW